MLTLDADSSADSVWVGLNAGPKQMVSIGFAKVSGTNLRRCLRLLRLNENQAQPTTNENIFN